MVVFVLVHLGRSTLAELELAKLLLSVLRELSRQGLQLVRLAKLMEAVEKEQQK